MDTVPKIKDNEIVHESGNKWWEMKWSLIEIVFVFKNAISIGKLWKCALKKEDFRKFILQGVTMSVESLYETWSYDNFTCLKITFKIGLVVYLILMLTICGYVPRHNITTVPVKDITFSIKCSVISILVRRTLTISTFTWRNTSFTFTN